MLTLPDDGSGRETLTYQYGGWGGYWHLSTLTSSRGNTLLGNVTYDQAHRPLSYQVGGHTTRTDTYYGTSSGKASWNGSEYADGVGPFGALRKSTVTNWLGASRNGAGQYGQNCRPIGSPAQSRYDARRNANQES